MFSMFVCCTAEQATAREIVSAEAIAQPDDSTEQSGPLVARPLDPVDETAATAQLEAAPRAEAAPKDVTPGEAEQPPANPALAKDSDVEEFEIVLKKQSADDTLGLNVMSGRLCLVCTGIEPGGMLERWNTENPERQVKYGSVIYEVNGVTSPFQAILEECANSETLTLKVRRHNRYTVRVVKKKILGLDLKGRSLTVTRLTPATATIKAEDMSLSFWNSTCSEGLEIMPGDRVAEVNGQAVKNRESIRELKDMSGEITLVLVRQ